MSAVISLSDRLIRPDTHVVAGDAMPLGRVRVAGGVQVVVSDRNGVSRIDSVGERDGYKVRFPRRGVPPEAIVINTGGGLAAGDRVEQVFDVGANAGLTVTTQASERVYRSIEQATTTMAVRAEIGPGATLAWLPQDTILFDRARFKRSMAFNMAADARLLVAETVVLGRTLMGERFREGLFEDTWRVRRGGRLAFAENVRLDHAALDRLTEVALAGKAHVIMTLVFVAPDAGDRLAAVRTVLSDVPFDSAASAWGGLLVVRGLAARTEQVRHLLRALLPVLGAGPLPRAWWT
jgi:urease accessory protein